MRNKHITINHPGGVGDGIMFSSIIKEKYAKEYDEVYVDVGRLSWLFKVLYADTPNIKLGSNGAATKLQFHNAVEHTSWRKLTWIKNNIIENNLYEEIVNKVGRDYILVHERKFDNMGRKMIPINRNFFLDKNLPVVNLDDLWLKSNGFSIENILHYEKVLNNAKEIHFYEGSFMNFADSVVKEVPLFGHLYCKPHYFDEKMVHYNIIKYIRANKWHKNKWNYIWEI